MQNPTHDPGSTIPVAPLTDDAPPEAIAAVATRLSASGTAAHAQAVADREAADAVLDEARAQAARLVANAETTHRKTAADATRRERAAETLLSHAQTLTHAAAEQERVRAARVTLAALENELAAQPGKIADADADIVRLHADLAAAEAQLAAATDDGDIDAMTSTRGRIASIRDLIGAAEQRKAAARDRQDALGHPDGEMLPARNAANGRRVTQALDSVWPDRPGAAQRLEAEQAAIFADPSWQREMQRQRHAERRAG